MTKPPAAFAALLLRLIAAQACYYMIVSIDLTLTGLVGLGLAPTPALTTLPLSLIVVVGTICSFVAGHAAARFGYRPVMVIGALMAVGGGLVSSYAVLTHSFVLFCWGTALTGGYRAVGGFLRFIASEHAPDGQRERALSLVMYGGVIAAALGPFAAIAAAQAAFEPYVGSCLLIAVVGCLALFLALSMPKATGSGRQAGHAAVGIRSRTGSTSFQQAILVLVGSGFVMTLVMATGPLANDHAGHSPTMGATMIQWHLVGMFAPSFLSAQLLKRYGTTVSSMVGGVIMALGSLTGVLASSGWAMTATLALIGVGWNVFFVTGSALLLRSYPPGRGAKLQGFTDGTTAAISAVGSFGAAWLLHGVGWVGVNLIALLVITATVLPLAVLSSVERRRLQALAVQGRTYGREDFGSEQFNGSQGVPLGQSAQTDLGEEAGVP